MLYNDNDPGAVAWLRELISRGHLPAGRVDPRSVADLRSDDLAGHDAVHLFAGIGGWPLALEWAGWSGPVWTASLPCQPFSTAGKQLGESDDRHLWPVVRALVAKCRPPVIFGEQVASRAGREWLSRVRADLEGMGYAIGAADLCAASVGAPHIRQRLFWVADAGGIECETRGRGEVPREAGKDDRAPRIEGDGNSTRSGSEIGDGLGHADVPGPQRHRQPIERAGKCTPRPPGWDDFDIVRCIEPTRDGGAVEKWRRVESGVEPLAAGVSGRMGLLRGFGNAIVPQVAATFVKAFMDVRGDDPGGTC